MKEERLTKLVLVRILGLTAALASVSGVAAPVHVVTRVQEPHFNVTEVQVRDLFMGISVEVDGVSLKALDRNELRETLVRERFFQGLFGKSLTQMRSVWSQLIFTGRGYPPDTVGDLGALKKALAEKAGRLGFVDETELDGSLRSLIVLPDLRPSPAR